MGLSCTFDQIYQTNKYGLKFSETNEDDPGNDLFGLGAALGCTDPESGVSGGRRTLS